MTITAKPLMKQNTHTSPHSYSRVLPTLKRIETDLVERGLPPNTRQLYLFLWRAKTQTPRLPLGLIFSEKTLARETHMSTRTVRRSLQRLEMLGLLRIISRKRANGGTTSNRYVLTWQPLKSVPQPTITTVERVHDTTESAPASEPTPTPDTVFMWPEVSEGSPSDCPRGESARDLDPSTIETSIREPIPEKKTFSKSDQPIPGAPLWTFSSKHDVQLFLIAMLQKHQISIKRIRHWLRHYDMARVAQVAIWMVSAPPKAIQFPGGWMERALREEWAAPRWVHELRQRRIDYAEHLTYLQTQKAQEIADEERIHAAQTEATAQWERLAPRLSELSGLKVYAAELARKALGSLFAHVFREGSPTWRSFILKAAQERPDLVTLELAEECGA
ncbi:HTH domain-containing protein [Sulfobacillus thermosulfidooxidans]|uniref:HTH domain-containing protein n=1 Tax=Sulfobacillus thermosulfidooxidans TaxID=28034 RepID=UPI0006B5E1FD|nr:HTH domain-containing protein [Sulfobacillus thermosulfidooxidans]